MKTEIASRDDITATTIAAVKLLLFSSVIDTGFSTHSHGSKQNILHTFSLQ